MSEQPSQETPSAPAQIDIKVIYELFETMQQNQNKNFSELRNDIESIKLSQDLLQAASPDTIPEPRRTSSERRSTIYLPGKQDSSDMPVKTYLQPKTTIPYKDQQEHATISATRRTIRFRADYNAKYDEDNPLHRFFRDTLIQKIVNDQRVGCT